MFKKLVVALKYSLAHLFLVNVGFLLTDLYLLVKFSYLKPQQSQTRPRA